MSNLTGYYVVTYTIPPSTEEHRMVTLANSEAEAKRDLNFFHPYWFFIKAEPQTVKFKKGDRIQIKKGTLYYSMKDSNTHISGRTYTVTVFSCDPPYEGVDGQQHWSRPGKVKWVGTGGYWCWADPDDVELA